MTWCVEVPDAPVVNFNKRSGHYNARYQSHRQWREQVAWLARTVKAPFPSAPVVVTLACVQSDRRRRDPDNQVAGTPLKGALDGLVDAGLLDDDSWRQVAEVRCRLTSDPGLDVHRWFLSVVSAGGTDDR